VESSVTTAWKVQWDEELIARDILQNFYDENCGRLSEVLVSVRENRVTISAPKPFDLERLYYLGSEKGTDDVGHYGEGFKAAALCLLRDHGVTPITYSGNKVVGMRIAEKPAIENSKLFPIVYEYFENKDPVNGTRLVLHGCNKPLTEALQAGLSHFFYPGNPLLGKRLWSTRNSEFAIYESREKDGHIFYRKLRRGNIPDIPVVLVINKEYRTIENKIGKDRDRNAFGGNLRQTFYRRFVDSAISRYGRVEAQRIILEAARHHWPRGHQLLHALAASRPAWTESMGRPLFGDRYYAASISTVRSEQLEFDSIEEEWKKEGRQKLPGYFEHFGAPSARRHLQTLRERAKQEILKKGSRKPTEAEEFCLSLLAEVLEKLAPQLMEAFRKQPSRYTVAKTDVVLGQLRQARGYHSREVIMAEKLFTGSFSSAFAVFLHEHGHIFGGDYSRAFSDALTDLINAVICKRSLMDAYEELWSMAVEQVRRERAEAA